MKKHFIATSLEHGFSRIVDEKELASMLSQKIELDDAHLLYVTQEEQELPAIPLDTTSFEMFEDTLDFLHAPGVFHQNALTKKSGSKQPVVAKQPMAPPVARPQIKATIPKKTGQMSKA